MKATEQYFPVVLFIMLYEVVLTFESVDSILKCHHSSESFQAEFFDGGVCLTKFTKMKFGNFGLTSTNPWPVLGQ